MNQQRVKPAKGVRVGDTLRIQRGSYEYRVTVLGLKEKRVSAKEAAKLYEESQESIEKRQLLRERLKLERAQLGNVSKGRPDKRQRRHIIQFRRDNESTSD